MNISVELQGVCVYVFVKCHCFVFFGHTQQDISVGIKSHNRNSLVCFLVSFQLFYLLSVISEFTRPVLREQICVYTQLLTGMTFNNNNNRRCLDLLATMATGIRQRLLLC